MREQKQKDKKRQREGKKHRERDEIKLLKHSDREKDINRKRKMKEIY